MALTPLEIHNKEFKTRMRGFDQDEVNEFLDQVIRDYELLMRENKDYEDELNLVNKKLDNYEEMQESLNKSIIVAQDAADRLKENTEKELDVIKREAESYAENVRQEADKYAEDVRQEADTYAEDVHNEADDNADELLEEAVLKAHKIEDETEALRKQSRVFRQRLQLLIESQLELLTNEDWDNLLVGEPIEFPETETIQEVEKELDEKIADAAIEAEPVDEEDATADYEEAEDEMYEETEEAVAFEETEENTEANSAAVAIDAKESYNNDDSEKEAKTDEEDYEEGTMPAVELPDSASE